MFAFTKRFASVVAVAVFLGAFGIGTGQGQRPEVEAGDEHLVMGNPSGAVADREKPANFLLKKRQYALSFNNSKGTANWDTAFDTLIDSFKVLTALLDKQGIKPSGNALIVYTSTDDTGFTYMAEIPVEQEPKNLAKNMSLGKSPEGKALKFVHRGSYDNMDNTYEAITNHLDDKKLEAKDTFIEEYLTDPLKTAEDKLVINVYVPLR